MSNRSTFPMSIDTFVEHYDIQGSDATNVKRYSDLKMKSNLTQSEATELVNLTTLLREKIFTPEDFNKLQDCITNLETFFKENVEDYILNKQTEFNAEVNKFAILGQYEPARQYYTKNMVKLSGETYICIQNCLGIPPSPEFDTAYWVKLALKGDRGETGYGVGLSPKGDYSNTTLYRTNDLVTYGGDLYRCLQDNTGNLPNVVSSTYWTLFLSGSGEILSSLTTDNKSSLVGAINEVNAKTKITDTQTGIKYKITIENGMMAVEEIG